MKLGNPGACVAPEHGGSYFTTSAPTLHTAVFLQGAQTAFDPILIKPIQA
jgi:hypothetical protein